MSPNPDDQLAGELARAMVARAAPHELPIFRAASRAYFDNPDRALRRRSADDMLGFGADSMAALTPYALAIARGVIGRLGSDMADVRQLLAGSSQGGTSSANPLTAEQLDHVRALSLQGARELGLDEGTAVLLSDAMVGTLIPPPS